MKKITILLILFVGWVNGKAQSFPIELFASGFEFPLDIQNAGDSRLFIVEKNGKVKITNPDGSVNSIPFIDLSSKIDASGEGGLLGLAFHPNYNSNGFFFLSYIDLNGDTQISRFSVSSGDINVADPNSELSILNYERDTFFHYGGAINFGPDGYLYIASGDAITFIESQNTSSFLGKLLRLDIDNPSGGNNYGIPPDNPFAGSTTDLEEIWALGLRNPWKFSFDFQENNLWIADVGQTTLEEINKNSLNEGGLNYGWPCYEGTHFRESNGCPPMNKLAFPVAEYTHDIGYSVTGGYVYRGNKFPEYNGKYIFADYGTDILGWVNENDEINFTTSYKKNWSSLGLDANGEIYIAALFSGEIYKLELILSTPENIKQKPLIYPNPTTHQVFINSDNSLINSVTLFDINGRQLSKSEGSLSNTITLQLSQYSKGIYFVNMEDTLGNSFTQKIILK